MARSFHLHPAQALSAAQLYTHWKWRVLLLVNGCMFWGVWAGGSGARSVTRSLQSPPLGHPERRADGGLQLAHELRGVGRDVTDSLGHRWLCERHVLQSRHPSARSAVATAGTRTRLRHHGHLRRLCDADHVARHWLGGGDIRLAHRLPLSGLVDWLYESSVLLARP
jgi:hypothetical protein